MSNSTVYKELVPGKAPGNWLLVVLLLAITFVVFIPCLSAYYVDIDDPIYLINNTYLEPFSQQWSWENVLHFFTKDAQNNYIPLTTFTYAIEKYLFAPDTMASPFIFHLDNLLLHLACTVCVFFLFLKMDLNRYSAFIGALLFGIHPMRVESVAWVSERKDVLYGLLFLLSLLCYINYIKEDNKNRKWYIGSIIFAILSGFAKVQAVTIPLCMVALDIYFARKWYASRIMIVEKLPWWVISMAFGLINVYVLASQKVLESISVMVHYDWVDKFALGMYTYAVYVVKFIYPYQLSVYYDYPVKVPVIAYISLGVVPIVLALVIWLFRRNRVVLFAVAFFTFNVVFMLQIVSSGNTFMAERYTYIAYIGLFFLVAKVFDWVTKRFREYRWPVSIFIGLYLILFAVMTFGQSKVWQNSISLWKNAIKVTSPVYFGYYQVANYYIYKVLSKIPDPYLTQQNDTDYIGLARPYLDVLIHRANVYGALSIGMTSEILFDHAMLCGKDSLYQYAIDDLTKVIALTPQKKDAYENRGYAYYFEKQYDKAVTDLVHYTKMDTTDPLVYFRSGVSEAELGRFGNAAADISKAIRLDSANIRYYLTRAKVYKALNEPVMMRADAQKARQMGAAVPPALLE